MKTITMNEARKLINASTAPAISIFMGTDPKKNTNSDTLKEKLQRLYNKAEDLVVRNYDARTTRRLMGPLQKAISLLKLKTGKGGLGIYHSEHFTGIVSLPILNSEIAVASESFHVKPILRCTQSKRSYFLITLMRKKANLHLVHGNETKLLEEVSFFPPDKRAPNFASLVGNSPPKRLRLRRSQDLLSRAQAVVQRFESFWQYENVPLLLVGPKNQQDAFRAFCHYRYLSKVGIEKNVDLMRNEDIGYMANKVMESFFARAESQSLFAFYDAERSGLTTTCITEIAKSAASARVQYLFIAEDKQVWGHLEKDSGQIEILDEGSDSAADDLLDDIAELTVSNGGHVIVLPSSIMPKNQPIAAILMNASQECESGFENFSGIYAGQIRNTNLRREVSNGL
ncbi:MAG: hypothetical protein NT027_07475 [Proteobacteria bacterium]|nr:hypothetical protein [Pseudomonadota bacterium]